MLLFVVYYNHKVRERATSKPTLRDVGNLHEPYKSPPLCQRLTLIALPEHLFGAPFYPRGEQMFGARYGRTNVRRTARKRGRFFSEQMFCPNKARDHRPRAYVQVCGATYPVVLGCVYHTVYVCIYLLCIIHYIIVC